MSERVPQRWSFIAVGALLAALAAPALAQGQVVNGQARVVKASIVELTGIATTVLSDTGSLTDSSDARETSQTGAAIPSLLRGGTLHATTIGWPDQVAS